MDDLHRKMKILQRLKDLLFEAYASAEGDRHRLHELEFSSSPSPFDVALVSGLSEITVDNIVGWATRRRIDRINKSEALESLQENCIYNSKILGEWLVNEGENYKDFSRYLHLAELMRLLFIEVLEGYDENSG